MKRCPPLRARGRRGVLLLVVLSLLVLFVLIGVTFVLVASQSRRMSRADSRAEQYGDDYRRQLDDVFAQVVRDTTNTNSVLRSHSLLNDIYGLDGARGTISAAPTAIASGQFYDISATTLNNVAGSLYPTTAQIQTPGYFNGCVLTMLDGPAKYLSTRIVGWGYAGTTYTIRVMAFDWPNTLASTTFITNSPAQTFLINGRPFNGTGFGFNTTSGVLDLPENFTVGVTTIPVPYALLPNAKFNGNVAGIGGADEDYDAADPQNMLLGYMPIAPAGPLDILPSLHRPDLVSYMKNNPAYSTVWPHPTAGPSMLRQIMLRPMGQITIGGAALPFGAALADHPDFTGSNPSFDAVLGPWDVDNDGDGIADSVWVDIGMPVQTAPDGRRFKPLAAILCLDLDGRLNVNAHGNTAQVDTNYSTPIPPGGVSGTATIADYLYTTTGIALPVTLPRGSGYGPAEINLGLSPGIFAAPVTDYPLFLKGRTIGTRNYEGRYGEFTAAPNPLPGVTALLPSAGADDVLDSIKRFDFPNNYYTSPLSNYGTPGDLWGRAAMGVDYAGQPIYSFLQNPVGNLGTSANDLPNDPYTLNLSHNRVRSAALTPTLNDNAFTASELERILRKFDVDVSALPDRLRILLDPTFGNTNDYGRIITSDSFDLPSPSFLATADLKATLLTAYPGTVPNIGNLHDLLRAKLIKIGGYTLPLIPANQTIVNNLVTTLAPTLFPPELLAGVRFDLNRPFGNGVDDSAAGSPGAGVVDEPTAAEFNVKNEVPATWTSATAFGAGAPTGFDLNNDGVIDADPTHPASDLYARQQYAKHLYVLMMLLADQSYVWGQDASGPVSAAQQQELTARRIAQWAVNVVDFRDPDSIMTPFEYDVNPFNGWDVDGILTAIDPDAAKPDRRVVWGCEAPELLLTETLAFHDRRVDDTSTDNGIQKKLNEPIGVIPDPDMDQVRIPEGSVFLELYCPHNGNASMKSAYSADLYDNSGAQPRLDLGRMAPAGAAVPAYPVWRIAITQSRFNAATGAANDINTRVGQHPDEVNFDPVPPSTTVDSFHGGVFDPLNTTPGPISTINIDRYVWFSATDPTGNPDDSKIYYNKTGSSTLLSPGRYAVVGPRPTTYVGKASATNTPATQKFQLDTAAGTVAYTPANASAPNATATSNPALPIICSSTLIPPGFTNSVGVSVTEPLPNAGYYTFPTQPGPIPGVDDKYLTPIDHPFDKVGPLGQENLLATKLTPNYKTALLQRLANPLVAYDLTTNPYITVDWQPIDLNVFNGDASFPLPSPLPDPDDPGYTAPATLLAPGIGSRERGVGTAVAPIPNLWNSYPQQSTNLATIAKGANAVFDYNFNQSLGYINKSMGTPWLSPPTTTPQNYGYTNAPNPTLGNAFPWLTWNNRPFTSNMELLQVPATSAEQLMRQFSTANTVVSPYDAVTSVPAGFNSPFSHLLNFMLTSDGTPLKAPYFYRLLEYVQVPSRFVGTETFLKPSNFASPLPTAAVEQTLASFYHPPFNKVSNYRDPGRVNINTIAADPTGVIFPVWNAILNGGPGPSWQQIVTSRRGGAPGNVTTPTLPAVPTVFPNPFRSAGGAAFYLPGTTIPASEVSVTLLRPDLANPAVPLFSTPAAAVLPYTNPDRNPYFRYQTLQRLSNLLTTRSNVYAVWITVGYFEAGPPRDSTGALISPVNYTIYPDGYQLGREVGSDSGEIKRHRAFYIYDRSIPVGFEPGRDHNIDKGVLVKRFIE